MRADRKDTLDLTRAINRDLPIFTDGAYSDPPFLLESWCTIREQGYQVSRLSLGTQTGTHIDAPAHFDAAGATLESLPLRTLIGPYLWVDLDPVEPPRREEINSRYRGEMILFLHSSGPSILSDEGFEALLDLPCPVWVTAFGIRIAGRDSLYFFRALSKAGKFLIEDLEEEAARRVKPGGEMMALPLRLEGVSGSPCRVVIRQNLSDEASVEQ